MQTPYATEGNIYVNNQSINSTELSTSGDDTSVIDRDSEEYEWIRTLYPEGWEFTNQNYICRIVDQEKKTAYITRIKELEGDVTIPNEIDGYKIIGIAAYNFEADPDWDREDKEVFVTKCRNKITNLTIEEGIEWIGDRAFVGCTSLNEINLPNSLKIIGGAHLLDAVN